MSKTLKAPVTAYFDEYYFNRSIRSKETEINRANQILQVLRNEGFNLSDAEAYDFLTKSNGEDAQVLVKWNETNVPNYDALRPFYGEKVSKAAKEKDFFYAVLAGTATVKDGSVQISPEWVERQRDNYSTVVTTEEGLEKLKKVQKAADLLNEVLEGSRYEMDEVLSLDLQDKVVPGNIDYDRM